MLTPGQVVEEILGALLGITVLLDIFFLVLYARANTGVFSERLSRLAWQVIVRAAQAWGRSRRFLLALTGPVILLMVLGTWALLLSLASALIIHPNLGMGVKAIHGSTPTDFITALYVGGSSLSFVGASDFSPQTPFFRFFYLLTSVIGISLVSLIVTYLMQLYENLQQRNALGLRVHLLSAETGDAADVIAGLGPQGRFEAGSSDLAEWAAEISRVRESHHFYPVLFYFRFREPYYSVSRTALIALDTVTLIRSALDDSEFGWLKESAALEQLQRGNLLQLRTLMKNVSPDADLDTSPDEQTRENWQRRYERGVARLNAAGIKTTRSGAEEYISLRARWDPYITHLAPLFAYDMDEIDTALADVKGQQVEVGILSS